MKKKVTGLTYFDWPDEYDELKTMTRILYRDTDGKLKGRTVDGKISLEQAKELIE